MKKRTLAALLSLTLCATMASSALAADSETISAQLNRQIQVTYNGAAQAFADATGATVYPISYKDTTYLPVRAVSGLLDMEVAYDEASNTVSLKSAGAAPTEKPASTPKKGNNETISAVLDRGMTITYNSEKQSFQDATGAAVYPISYQGTTYLPVRAVSGLMSLPVSYDDKTNTVILGTAPAVTTPPSGGVSAKLFDNQVSINGTVISFPAKMTTVAGLGFKLPANKQADVLNANTFTSGRVENASGDKIFAGFSNSEASGKKLSECVLEDANFTQDGMKNTKLVFAGGITFGAAQSAVTAAFGEPTKKADGGTTAKNTRETYKYEKPGSYKDYVTFSFTNGALTGVEIYTAG